MSSLLWSYMTYLSLGLKQPATRWNLLCFTWFFILKCKPRFKKKLTESLGRVDESLWKTNPSMRIQMTQLVTRTECKIIILDFGQNAIHGSNAFRNSKGGQCFACCHSWLQSGHKYCGLPHSKGSHPIFSVEIHNWFKFT